MRFGLFEQKEEYKTIPSKLTVAEINSNAQHELANRRALNAEKKRLERADRFLSPKNVGSGRNVLASEAAANRKRGDASPTSPIKRRLNRNVSYFQI